MNGGVYFLTHNSKDTDVHFHTPLHMHIKWPKPDISRSLFTFECSACKRFQAAGTSPYWRVCARWTLKVGESGEPASPEGTRLIWPGSSEVEERVPCGAHRRAVSSCDGPSARVLSGSSHSWDSWLSPHSNAFHRSVPQGRGALRWSFPLKNLC